MSEPVRRAQSPRTADGWIRDRFTGSAPAELIDAMIAALPADAPTVADAFAQGALALYREVIGGTGGREVALSLLAADALFTHAFEAKAEDDVEGLADLALHYGAAGRLRELVA